MRRGCRYATTSQPERIFAGRHAGQRHVQPIVAAGGDADDPLCHPAGEEDDPWDKCDTHSRESFHALTALLGLTLYVDFPDNPADCHGKDPQNARPAKAEAGSPANVGLRFGMETGVMCKKRAWPVTWRPRCISLVCPG